MGIRLSTGCSARKKLGNISNFQQQQPKPVNKNVKQQPASLKTTNEYIDKLQKENMVLFKLLEDRNKVIELIGIELQKLRINFQKLQQQNLQLAQANSHMLAEVNSGRVRLKALQHELGCKNGLLKAGKLLAVRVKKEVRDHAENDELEQNVQMAQKHDEAAQSFQADKDNKDRHNKKRRRSRIQSFDPPAKTVHAKQKIDNKSWHCSRRQSSRVKSEEAVATEDLFEIDDTTFPVSSIHDEDAVHKPDPASMEKSVKEETKTAPRSEAQELRRLSIGKPSRQAAEKVQSYKEIPLNVKMRRED